MIRFELAEPTTTTAQMRVIGIGGFSGKVRWVNFGGLPGSDGQAAGGLEQFKRGWSNTTRKAYFCGRILDRQTCECLAAQAPNTKYFPSYREGEF